MGEKVMTMKSSNLLKSVSCNSQGKQMVMYFKQGGLGEIEFWIQFKEYLFESMMDRQLDFSTQHSNGERENVEKNHVMLLSGKKPTSQAANRSYRQPMFFEALNFSLQKQTTSVS